VRDLAVLLLHLLAKVVRVVSYALAHSLER